MMGTALVEFPGEHQHICLLLLFHVLRLTDALQKECHSCVPSGGKAHNS